MAFRWWIGDGMIFQGDPDPCVHNNVANGQTLNDFQPMISKIT